MGDNSGCNEANEIVVNVNKDVSNKTQEDSNAHATASLLQKVSFFLSYYCL